MWKTIVGALVPVLLLPVVISAGFGPDMPSVRAGVIPAGYVGFVTAAGEQCPTVTVAVIAAQLDTESSWNPTAVSPAGAQGIAQFMPATWATWGRDENGDATADPFDPADAIPAQARFMCSLVAWAEASGIAGDPLSLALAAYNAGTGAVERHHGIPPFPETTGYVATILAKIATYTVPTAGASGDGRWQAWATPPAGVEVGEFGYPAALTAVDNPVVAVAISFALGQVGKPYEYGAHGPDRWDCSGLLQAAFGSAGVAIGGWTGDQIHDGTRIGDFDSLRPGDLVFIPGADGTISNPAHVGLYLGDGLILQAPQTGDHVRITPLGPWRSFFAFAQRVV